MMVEIKQEVDIEHEESDTYLFYWTNEPKKEIKEEKVEGISDEESVSGKSEYGRGRGNQLSTFNHVKSENLDQSICHGETTKSKTAGKDGKKSVTTKKPREDYSQKEWYNKIVESATVTVSTVETLCKYQCPKRKGIYTGSDSLKKHFQVTNHKEGFQERNIHYIVKVLAFKCQICSKKILCERSIIAQHMMRMHKTSISRRYNIANMISSKQISNGNNSVDLDQISANIANNYRMSDFLGNFCKFSCKVCDYSSNQYLLMPRHMRSTGHEPQTSAIQAVTNATLYKCKVQGVPQWLEHSK